MKTQDSIYVICKPVNNCNQNCQYCFDKNFHNDNPQILDKQIIYDMFTKIVEDFNFIE